MFVFKWHKADEKSIYGHHETGKKKFPYYHELRAAKAECYPNKEAIVISDSGAEATLQALLVSPLLKTHDDVITTLSEDKHHKL